MGETSSIWDFAEWMDKLTELDDLAARAANDTVRWLMEDWKPVTGWDAYLRSPKGIEDLIRYFKNAEEGK